MTFGGKKNVIEKEIVVGLETGMCLLHKHGNDCMLVRGFPCNSFFFPFLFVSFLFWYFWGGADACGLQHEGREVLEGEKWVIRSDLCVKRGKSRFAD